MAKSKLENQIDAAKSKLAAAQERENRALNALAEADAARTGALTRISAARHEDAASERATAILDDRPAPAAVCEWERDASAAQRRMRDAEQALRRAAGEVRSATSELARLRCEAVRPQVDALAKRLAGELAAACKTASELRAIQTEIEDEGLATGSLPAVWQYWFPTKPGADPFSPYECEYGPIGEMLRDLKNNVCV